MYNETPDEFITIKGSENGQYWTGEKIYKSKYGIFNIETYGIFGVPLFALIFIFGAIIPNPLYSSKEKIMTAFIILGMFGFLEFILLLVSKFTIIINDEGLIWKALIQTIKVSWDEVKGIQVIRGRGVTYKIKTKKGNLDAPTTIENLRDLFKQIKKRIAKYGAKIDLNEL